MSFIFILPSILIDFINKWNVYLVQVTKQNRTYCNIAQHLFQKEKKRKFE